MPRWPTKKQAAKKMQDSTVAASPAKEVGQEEHERKDSEKEEPEDVKPPLEPTQPAPPQFRKSCQFCRRRKIKCLVAEGEEKCTPCIKRGHEVCTFAERGAPDEPPPMKMWQLQGRNLHGMPGMTPNGRQIMPKGYGRTLSAPAGKRTMQNNLPMGLPLEQQRDALGRSTGSIGPMHSYASVFQPYPGQGMHYPARQYGHPYGMYPAMPMTQRSSSIPMGGPSSASSMNANPLGRHNSYSHQIPAGSIAGYGGGGPMSATFGRNPHMQHMSAPLFNMEGAPYPPGSADMSTSSTPLSTPRSGGLFDPPQPESGTQSAPRSPRSGPGGDSPVQQQRTESMSSGGYYPAQQEGGMTLYYAQQPQLRGRQGQESGGQLQQSLPQQVGQGGYGQPAIYGGPSGQWTAIAPPGGHDSPCHGQGGAGLPLPMGAMMYSGHGYSPAFPPHMQQMQGYAYHGASGGAMQSAGAFQSREQAGGQESRPPSVQSDVSASQAATMPPPSARLASAYAANAPSPFENASISELPQEDQQQHSREHSQAPQGQYNGNGQSQPGEQSQDARSWSHSPATQPRPVQPGQAQSGAGSSQTLDPGSQQQQYRQAHQQDSQSSELLQRTPLSTGGSSAHSNSFHTV